MSERCGICRFWAGEKMVPDEPSPVTGRCRRRPPVATGGMMSAAETIWPWTSIEDWCGDYAPNEAELARQRKEVDDDPCPF